MENKEKPVLSTQDILKGLNGELAQQRKGLKNLGGNSLVEGLNRIDDINRQIKEIEDGILPSSPGFRAIGNATHRASHGGTFEPSNRSNR